MALGRSAGRRKRDFYYCGLSESTVRRKPQRLEELNRA
jgi:hypothetical protein